MPLFVSPKRTFGVEWISDRLLERLVDGLLDWLICWLIWLTDGFCLHVSLTGCLSIFLVVRKCLFQLSSVRIIICRCWESSLNIHPKPVLNWANYLFAEHTSDSSTNYNSFLNWTFTSSNMVRQFHELFFVLNCLIMRCKLRPELAAEAQADSMIQNVG